jgi:DsbC/DsbD-like thiol-disulfide interchange protein
MRLRSACVRCEAFGIISVLAALSAAVVADGAQPAPAAYGTVGLIAKETLLQAGQTATLGVLFDLRPGWHIYWVNPGDAGGPPRMEWELPPGFRAGEIRWPVPQRLVNGAFVDYGYEGRVLLPIPLQVPADYPTGKPAMLAADLRFVVCRDVCVSGRTRLTLMLPALTDTSGDPAATRELFRAFEARLPRPAPPEWDIRAEESRDRFVLEIRTGSPESGARFFPLEPGQIDNLAPQTVSPEGRDSLRLTLRKSDLLQKPLAALKGVLVLDPDRAFEIAAPVSAER